MTDTAIGNGWSRIYQFDNVIAKFVQAYERLVA